MAARNEDKVEVYVEFLEERFDGGLLYVRGVTVLGLHHYGIALLNLLHNLILCHASECLHTT